VPTPVVLTAALPEPPPPALDPEELLAASFDELAADPPDPPVTWLPSVLKEQAAGASQISAPPPMIAGQSKESEAPFET